MDDDRKNGRGIVIEYANRTVSQPDETIPIVFGKINADQRGFNRWTINSASFDENAAPRKLRKGKRHRLVSDNRTDDAHPIHLRRNSFELTNVNGKSTFPKRGITPVSGWIGVP
jgi:FtsP/CotA-like multicopper oxidase with cupredoxin domain